MLKFRLLDFQVVKVDLEATSFEKKSTKTLQATSFSVDCMWPKELGDKFGILYDITLKNKNNEFNLVIRATAHFECDAVIDDQFMQSDFVRINAPAIGFPYLRAFISNFTLSAGFNPIFLPTYNFVAMAQEKKKKELAMAKKAAN
jgi:preprotein translocase subunit SecB